MLNRPFSWSLGALAGYLVMSAVWITLGAPSGSLGTLPANLAIIPPFLLAALLVWRVSRLPRIPAPRTWRLLAFGLLSWGLGALTYTIYDFQGLSPYPSLADVGYLSGTICLAAGLMTLRRERLGALHTLSFLTDAALVTLILGNLLWSTTLRDVLADTALSPLERGISLAYPVMDLLLCAATVTLALWRPLGIKRRVAALLATAGLCFLATDVLYVDLVTDGRYTPGNVIDLGWPLAALLVAWAAYRSAQVTPAAVTPDASREGWKRLLPHYAVLGVFVAYLINHLRAPLDALQEGILWLTVGLFVTRQLLVLADDQRLQQSLTHRAEHDPLTGVRNRDDLEVRLQLQIDEAQSWNGAVAVLFVDLDRMKEINDTFGHSVGDRLLRAVADRLTAQLPPGAMISRFGGDEFVAVLPAQGAEDIAGVAQALLDTVGRPYQIGAELLNISASIGVSLAPGDAADAASAIEQADMAMYRAKQAGKGTWRFANEQLNSLHMPQARLEVLLRGALGRGEFALAYQPLIDLGSGRVRSFEALMRWTSPDLGPVSPADFIPVAETREMMGGLGRWALHESVREMCAWQADLPGVSVAVNVSATQFAHENFVDSVRAALHEHCSAPHLLTLELTESAVLADVTQTRQKLQELGTLGVRVALDDFGTGYSSLGQLRSLPVDVLKIDRVFTQDSETDAAFLQAMISMGHSLGLEVVAEGIENASTLARLQALGCDLGQGYHLARPQPAAEAVAAMVRFRLSCGTEARPLGR